MMTPSLQSLGIDRLNDAERLELIGAIWDTFPAAGGSAEVPEWHRDVVADCLRKLESGESALLTWDELLAKIGQR